MGLRIAPRFAALLALALLGWSCGREAPPQPPVIRVAERTRDLAAHQEGTEAVLTWSYPSATTAGGSLPDLEVIEVWRLAVAPAQEPRAGGPRQRQLALRLMEQQGERIARLKRDQLERFTRGPTLFYRDDLLGWYRANAHRMPLVLWYAVRTRCCGGRYSEFSNIARLVPAAPPEAPAWAGFEVNAGGITLHWAGEAAVLVERRAPGGTWRRLTPDPVKGGSWEDTGASQGKTWSYRLRAVRGSGATTVVGEPGPVLEVAYPDVYPPEAPGSLVCLPEPGLVRLRWEPSRDAVFYRVFRRSAGRGGWARLAWQLRGGTSFVDRNPPAGPQTYAVKAVDAAGNESEAATCETTVTRQ